MPTNKKYLATFTPKNIYHIYNRTNNKEPLFNYDSDRLHFLEIFDTLLSPYFNTYAWSLMPNHFHWLVKTKPEDIIIDHLLDQKAKSLMSAEKKFILGLISFDELISCACKRFFVSYSMHFNKRYNRTGNLFQRQFKRLSVDDYDHLTRLVLYIHANSIKHGVANDINQYEWSSWKELISDNPTSLLRDELWQWFGGKASMIESHFELADLLPHQLPDLEEIITHDKYPTIYSAINTFA